VDGTAARVPPYPTVQQLWPSTARENPVTQTLWSALCLFGQCTAHGRRPLRPNAASQLLGARVPQRPVGARVAARWACECVWHRWHAGRPGPCRFGRRQWCCHRSTHRAWSGSPTAGRLQTGFAKSAGLLPRRSPSSHAG
jgi:hypothetical protein